MDKKEEFTFEQAYDRLEEILEKMHAETVGLDEALALYEEADTLIASCQNKLTAAEKKIEILLKKRDGSLQVGPEDRPETAPFTPTRQAALQ